MKAESLGELRFLGINSPSTREVKTELPGTDPTSLYFAMSKFAENRARDLGITHIKSGRNLQEHIFNPKIWNEEAQTKLKEKLGDKPPSVVLISNTSPSHPFAIEIAKIIRETSTDALIVLGGPHEDETMKTVSQHTTVSFGSTLKDMASGAIPPVFDFIFSGDGEYAVDKIMTMVHEVVLQNPSVKRQEMKARILAQLKESPQVFSTLPGTGVLGAIDSDNSLALFPLSGTRFDLKDIPPLYRYFPNLSRFHVFVKDDGSVKQTAHLMTKRGCPNSCLYCSEPIKVVGVQSRIEGSEKVRNGRIIGQIAEAVGQGAEAGFFEDSIFMFGNKEEILSFTKLLTQVKQKAAENGNEPWVSEEKKKYLKRIAEFEWGCQFTAENTLLWKEDKERVLQCMKEAGCSYVFLGIESLSEEVMRNIQKYKNGQNGTYTSWAVKVRDVLTLMKKMNIKTGASILFGLPGETKETMDQTIDGITDLINDGLLDLVSPNLATYHPGTALTIQDGVEGTITFTEASESRPPYSFFEEADSKRISKRLTESDVWYVWRRINGTWNTLNRKQMESN